MSGANVSTNPPELQPGVTTLSMTPNGGLRTQPMVEGEDVSASNPLPVTGTFTPPALQNVNLTQVGSAAVQTGAGTAAGTLRVELPTDGTGKVGLNAGSAIVGKVGIDQTTPGTTNAVSATNFPTTIDTNSGNKSASTMRVVLATDQPALTAALHIDGLTASGSAIASAPVTVGGRAATANPTAVTDGQVVNAMFDKLGKQVAVGAIRTLKLSQRTVITASTSETTIVTATASTFNDLYGLVLANTGATATAVDIRDTTAGTIITTFQVPAGETRGFMLSVDSGYSQTTVNTNWTAQCSASTSSLVVTAMFVRNI